MFWLETRWGLVVGIELQSLVCWFYEEAFSSSILLIGVVSVGRAESDFGGTVTAYGERDVCEKGGELIRPHFTLENFAVFEEK